MGKDGGSSHTSVEAPDNLKSGQLLSVVDAIGEGLIERPVDGLKSVRINKRQSSTATVSVVYITQLH